MGLVDFIKPNKKPNKIETKNWENQIETVLPKNQIIILAIVTTKHSFTYQTYEVTNNQEIKHVSLFDELDPYLTPLFDEYIKTTGMRIYKYENQKLTDTKYISHYNIELFTTEAIQLNIYQQYGYTSDEEDDKQELEKSIKAEKIKNTLVYACYLNDTEKILEKLEKPSKTALNKRLKYYGTPLGICAENNNLEAFKALCENGADLNKISLAYTPLYIAFRSSIQIIKYVHDNHFEQFQKEIQKLGLTIAGKTQNIEIIELVSQYVTDLECENAEFPPLHTFADFNNTVGLQFLLDKGINPNIKNKYKQTALDRAKQFDNKEAIQLLEKHINQ